MEEVLQAALREITASPLAFLAEVLQSALLVAIVAWAGRRVLGKRLGARRARIAAELARAEAAERESARMREEAREAVEQASREAPGVVQAARDRAERDRQAAVVEVEAEAERAIRQAQETVAADERKVVHDASERLVRLTAEIARRYLDEVLTERERRALTDRVILDALDELERGAPAPGAIRRGG